MRYLHLLITATLPFLCTTLSLSLPNRLSLFPHPLHPSNTTFRLAPNTTSAYLSSATTPDTWPTHLPFTTPAPSGRTVRIVSYNARRTKHRGSVTTVGRDLHTLYAKILTGTSAYAWDGSGAILAQGVVVLYLAFEELKTWEGAGDDVLRFLSLIMEWTARSGQAREIEEAYVTDGGGVDRAIMRLRLGF